MGSKQGLRRKPFFVYLHHSISNWIVKLFPSHICVRLLKTYLRGKTSIRKYWPLTLEIGKKFFAQFESVRSQLNQLKTFLRILWENYLFSGELQDFLPFFRSSDAAKKLKLKSIKNKIALAGKNSRNFCTLVITTWDGLIRNDSTKNYKK